MDIRDLTRQSIIAAIYVAVTLSISYLAFGAIQFRFSEMLVVLAFYDRKNSIGLIIGCAIANMFSPFFMVDVIVGTLATAIVCMIISKQSTTRYIALTSAVVNGIIIGAMLHVMINWPIYLAAPSVAVGQMVVVSLGVLIAETAIKKNPEFKRIIVSKDCRTDDSMD